MTEDIDMSKVQTVIDNLLRVSSSRLELTLLNKKRSLEQGEERRILIDIADSDSGTTAIEALSSLCDTQYQNQASRDRVSFQVNGEWSQCEIAPNDPVSQAGSEGTTEEASNDSKPLLPFPWWYLAAGGGALILLIIIIVIIVVVVKKRKSSPKGEEYLQMQPPKRAHGYVPPPEISPRVIEPHVPLAPLESNSASIDIPLDEEEVEFTSIYDYMQCNLCQKSVLIAETQEVRGQKFCVSCVSKLVDKMKERGLSTS